jgi:serine/threonine-protein kinase RsbW
MARKSSDPEIPENRNSTGPAPDASGDSPTPAHRLSGTPIYGVVSDPSFFERLQTECRNVPGGIDFYADVPKLLVGLEAAGKFDLAFVLFAERDGSDIDVIGVRRLRLDFPQVVPLVILETCDQQCELRLLSVGVSGIILPPFDQMNRGQIRLDFLIPSELTYVSGINYEISILLKEFGFPLQDARINIPLACDEAITNAIVHGNKSQPEKKVNVQIYLSNSRFRIRVRDQGAGFDFESLADPRHGENVHRSSGRGVFLMRNIMDTVEYKEGGRVLELEKLNPNSKRAAPTSPDPET